MLHSTVIQTDSRAAENNKIQFRRPQNLRIRASALDLCTGWLNLYALLRHALFSYANLCKNIVQGLVKYRRYDLYRTLVTVFTVEFKKKTERQPLYDFHYVSIIFQYILVAENRIFNSNVSKSREVPSYNLIDKMLRQLYFPTTPTRIVRLV